MNFIYEENRIYAKDETGAMIAEVTFPNVSENIVNIDHTFVDDSLRGQGIAGSLLKAVAQTLRSSHKKAYPTCSYAIKWFAAHPDYADVYTEEPYNP